jgi:hypothetical protein
MGHVPRAMGMLSKFSMTLPRILGLLEHHKERIQSDVSKRVECGFILDREFLMTKMRISAAVALLIAASMSPQANAANLVLNAGFEGGVHTSGNNQSVPDNWVSNAAFDNGPSFNNVEQVFVHTGMNGLAIGNDENFSPLATLSQTFNDVQGATYSVMVFYQLSANGDSNAFLTVSAGGQSFTANGPNATPGFVPSTTFTFTGSGSDTITLSAQTHAGNWYVDDVSVNGLAPSSGVPEPSTWAMMLLGFAGLGLAFRRSRRKVSNKLRPKPIFVGYS